DARPHLQLFPYGPGLKAQLRILPFAPVAQDHDPGPGFPPGDGGATVIARVGERRLQARRDLAGERQRAQAVVEACPALAGAQEGDWDWTLEQPQQCLELLTQARELEEVMVTWPEGEKFRVSRAVDLDSLSLTVRRNRDWFELDGTLELEDGQVLEMQRLLELLRDGPGRFLPLGDDQFLTLTTRFRRQLEELQSFGEGQGRFHPLTAPLLEDLAGEVGRFKADKAWREQLSRLKEARNLEPSLPSTFKGELRDYQREGFNWLARLAHWGVGACLADDMGLGKTIQALALILTRAPQGPTLVVAPTSVAANWQEEAARFAPTLRVVLFAEADRQRALEEAGPFDLVIASYTLLQQEAEALAGVRWQTVVLDEAQAIKNPATKRSQAAMALDGTFKVITTGTPVENHLGELWNLFRFINPGLLGSRERFNERFAGPIERQGDQLARQRLKKLIQPFILRRTKQQVLQELPGRTDIVLHVDLDREEMAFYEALRRQALEQLAQLEDAPAGQKHLRILAQITRLRRACCHPQLVTPEVELGSSKLALFGKVLEELLDNRHKVLVFSQFVDHLTLIRRRLEERQVDYQYLDGSTPAGERRKRVAAFQAGEGEVFLISLKAGGTGLNLTAADYVIHMDPWWNPAVEDQASDRAHRIGQQRPVTVYRLVTRHTIEEKIVALHHQKRDLAEGLLEGTDISGRIGAEELMQLIREG
ncbi:MAG: DEAD/DEAH box helicase, partial [Candidatus Competibacteraceae bacterium]|nr:DEAD/DEAH box helicase [Candidatus Competibacteraceae bacterium]